MSKTTPCCSCANALCIKAVSKKTIAQFLKMRENVILTKVTPFFQSNFYVKFTKNVLVFQYY